MGEIKDAETTMPALHPQPVVVSQRHRSLDVLRGFALLGILGPNIVSFAWPSFVMHDPQLMSETLSQVAPQTLPHAAANELGYDITSIFFLGKMMFLFSLLFGAGVVMYARKFEGMRLAEGWWLWYRRMGWLLLIGLLHGVLLWYGDILVWYALCGLGALWWVRKWSPKYQLLAGSLSFLMGTAMMTALMIAWSMYVSGSEEGAESITLALNQEIQAYTGTYSTALVSRVTMLGQLYLIVIPFGYFWICSGIMMAGMGLTRLGVLTGERSTRFYALLVVVGLTLGIGISTAVHLGLKRSGIDNPGMIFQGIGQMLGIPTALGYAGLLILLVKLNVLRPITGALAAVGRMALSNYLLQSMLCTTIFYSHGFGYFGTVQYPQLWGVMIAIWVINIAFSLLWLRVFRFGPAEWLWRSLTYWHFQPLLRRKSPSISKT